MTKISNAIYRLISKTHRRLWRTSTNVIPPSLGQPTDGDGNLSDSEAGGKQADALNAIHRVDKVDKVELTKLMNLVKLLISQICDLKKC